MVRAQLDFKQNAKAVINQSNQLICQVFDIKATR